MQSVALKLNTDANFQFQNIHLIFIFPPIWFHHVRLVFEALLATCPLVSLSSSPSSNLASRQLLPQEAEVTISPAWHTVS